MHELVNKLTDGVRRSIGHFNEVLFGNLWSSDPLIRMWAADARRFSPTPQER
jgi:hypothetical protein